MSAPFKYARQSRVQPGSVADGGVPLGKLVAPLLKALRLDDQCRMGVLEERWTAVVGKGIAAHARPGRLENKTLVIFVDSSPWLSELHRMQRDLLAKLQSAFGREKIAGIRLQLDPGHG